MSCKQCPRYSPYKVLLKLKILFYLKVKDLSGYYNRGQIIGSALKEIIRTEECLIISVYLI